MLKNRIYVSLLILVLLCFTAACEQDRTSGKGLHLPKGSIENGRTAFIELNCHRCHTVVGVDLPAYEFETPLVTLELGGKVYRVKTYGELVTSITNPNHIISQNYINQLGKTAKEGDIDTIMPSFNDEMTVTQLIDLITFLDSRYQKLEPDYTGYGGFY